MAVAAAKVLAQRLDELRRDGHRRPRADHHQPGQPLRVGGGEVKRNGAAHRMAHQHKEVQFERVDDIAHQLGEGVDGGAGRRRRFAMSRQIDRNHAGGGQVAQARRPDEMVAAGAVEQHHRRPCVGSTRRP
jgi:hypothetical protein